MAPRKKQTNPEADMDTPQADLETKPAAKKKSAPKKQPASARSKKQPGKEPSAEALVRPASEATKPTGKAPARGRVKTTSKARPVAEAPAPVVPVAKYRGPRVKYLVIVESPTKAKTIEKYLGPDYTVRASYGHVRDLIKHPPRGQLGVDVENGWLPTYEVNDSDRHRDQLPMLQQMAAQAEMVYLAPDPDREGEAIAWHLKEVLNLPDSRARRVTFQEITKNAIQRAFSQPGSINMDRVQAQEARRFLDRGVGYTLSKLLRKKIKAESAGRVQSVAVRVIVERELEIEAFKSEEYWKVTAHLAPQELGLAPKTAVVPLLKKKPTGEKPADSADDGEEKEKVGIEPKPNTFLAELVDWAGKKADLKNEEQAQQVLSAVTNSPFTVVSIEQKTQQEKAPPPFTTSTLQQQANIRHGFSAQRTMSIAQELYQGVELGSEGSVALITYMRTDSTRISDDALRSCRERIQSEYGAPYLPKEPNRYASAKSAQEAHECVRPTDLAYTPQRVAQHLREDQRKVYELIYRRFVACQMTPAVFALTTVDIQADQAIFRAKGKVQKFDGYRRVLAPKGKQEDANLPALAEKQRLDLLDLLGSQHFTQPPPRYNEASLVKALEKEGIGRPSTYATIISTIQKRNYVVQKERRFFATDLGKEVTARLVKHFPHIVDMKFTSLMEEHFDQIEDGSLARNQVLDEFWGPFSQDLAKAEGEMTGPETGETCPRCQKNPLVKRFNRQKGTSFVGCLDYKECKFIQPREGEPERQAAVETEHNCPTCGKMMLLRQSKRGPFLGCSGYPGCKTTMNFDAEGKPVIVSQPTEYSCEKCGAPMLLRDSFRGKFLGCTAYPKCRNTKEVDEAGKPVEKPSTGIACDKCKAPMQIRAGRFGPFLGCTAYPKCRNIMKISAEMKEQLKDLLPKPAPKKPELKIEIQETCEECGGAMAVRFGRGGSVFLGCKKYPKCKGTREPSPETIDKIAKAQAAATPAE